jgi:hypothetical protein
MLTVATIVLILAVLQLLTVIFDIVDSVLRKDELLK